MRIRQAVATGLLAMTPALTGCLVHTHSVLKTRLPDVVLELDLRPVAQAGGRAQRRHPEHDRHRPGGRLHRRQRQQGRGHVLLPLQRLYHHRQARTDPRPPELPVVRQPGARHGLRWQDLQDADPAQELRHHRLRRGDQQLAEGPLQPAPRRDPRFPADSWAAARPGRLHDPGQPDPRRTQEAQGHHRGARLRHRVPLPASGPGCPARSASSTSAV